MRLHLGKQGETLSSIYRDYYGDVNLDTKWEEGFSYFVTCNEHILQTVFYKLNGGEIVLLPENEDLNFNSPAIKADDLTSDKY